MNNVINQMLQKYDIKNEQDEINAMKEVIQEIVLLGLSRGGFFNEAAFYGGTALRIFYGLDRFSEDLDFALLKPNDKFDLSKYFKYIEESAKAYGLNISISEKNSNVILAFNLMKNMEIYFLNKSNKKLFTNIKVKLIMDINAPAGANYDFRYRLVPAPYQIRLYDLSSLFAGKIHAILCRNWQKRTKGRDLYDYIFFLSKGAKVNMELVKNKLLESNYIAEKDKFNIDVLKKLLKDKFKIINYKDAKEEALPFIKSRESIDLWNETFFIDITNNLEAS